MVRKIATLALLGASLWACDKEEGPRAVEPAEPAATAEASPPGQAPAEQPAALPDPGDAEGKAPEQPGAGELPSDAEVMAAYDKPSEHWFGVYMLGKKVGHAQMRSAATDEGLSNRTRVVMKVQAPGATVEMQLEEERVYQREAPWGLVRSTFVQNASGLEDKRKLVVDGGKMTLERWLNGTAKKPRSLEPTKENLRAALATMPSNFDRVKVGDAVRVTMWNWEAEQDDEVSVAVKSIEEALHSGVKTKVATLDTRYERLGLTLTSRVTAEGVPLELSMGSALRLKLEEKSVAQSGLVGLDIIGAGVDVDRKLGPPRDIKELKLALEVPKGYRPPSAPNQIVEAGEGERLVVTLKSAPGAEVSAEDRQKALALEATIDHDAESIVAKAKALTEGAKDDRDKAHRIARFVHEALDKELATHLPSASTVLDKKVGDCTEHSWLFVALARAAGLPARPVYGVAYVGDGHQKFGYHAWVEVALDGRWEMMDPTWGELVADATHLRLSGELSDVASVMGGMKITVLEEPKR